MLNFYIFFPVCLCCIIYLPTANGPGMDKFSSNSLGLKNTMVNSKVILGQGWGDVPDPGRDLQGAREDQDYAQKQ